MVALYACLSVCLSGTIRATEQLSYVLHCRDGKPKYVTTVFFFHVHPRLSPETAQPFKEEHGFEMRKNKALRGRERERSKEMTGRW